MGPVEYEAVPNTATEDWVTEEPLKVHRPQATPLPKWQMVCFAGIRGSEPLIYFVIFPFLNELLVEYGIARDKRTTGYSAGALEAILNLSNTVAIVYWVRIADTKGRRPVLLFCTFGYALISALFGFPRTFIGLLAVRFLTGAFNGQSAVAKTYLAELADESNQAAAFAFMGLAWQASWSLSAIIGGYCSHIERFIPALGHNRFILDYPYALGPLVAASIPVLCVILGYFVMKETLLPQTDYQKKLADSPWTPEMWKAFRVFSCCVCVNISFQATIPLFLYTPVEAGGLGLSTGAIGTYYAFRCAIIVAIELPIYPRLHRKFGHAVMIKAQIGLYPFIYMMFPVLSLLRKSIGGDHMDPISFVLLISIVILECMGQTMFISGDLICTNAAPVKERQSKFNAYVEAFAKFLVLITNWSASSLFAWSADHQILGGYFVWLVLCVIASGIALHIFHFKEGDGWRKSEVSSPVTPLTRLNGS